MASRDGSGKDDVGTIGRETNIVLVVPDARFCVMEGIPVGGDLQPEGEEKSGMSAKLNTWRNAVCDGSTFNSHPSYHPCKKSNWSVFNTV